MKGIILAGGMGSRLYPLTKITNKHLLPVYNKPMIYFPLFTLKQAGITEVLIVSGKGHAGDFLELLGSGRKLGMRLTYEVQEEPGGIAQALGMAEKFINGEKSIVILGDNIIEDDISEDVKEFQETEKFNAKIFLKKVPNPGSYGVVEIEDYNLFSQKKSDQTPTSQNQTEKTNPNGKILSIIEKPENPKSDLAVTGLYFYDSKVFEVIKNLKPSARNELEITDVNSFYLHEAKLNYRALNGFWGDCGESYDSLVEATKLVQNSHLAKIDEKLSLK